MAGHSEIFQFWQRWSQQHDDSIHPDDHPFIDAAKGIDFQLSVGRPPTPWDGPLASALVIFCYANPKYSEKDLRGEYIEIMRKQIEGNEPLPIAIEHWATWYRDQFGFLGDLKKISNAVPVFNVCPYASRSMDGANGRVAAGLPSTWAAQKHLREVLIPKARAGKILLVMPRAHRRWGVIQGFKEDNIVVETAPHGRIPIQVQSKIQSWLDQKQKSAIVNEV